MTQESISLNKYVSDTGVCSRREADRWIEAGRIKINGKVAKKGNRVNEGDQVTIDGRKINKKPKLVYIALNKPPGITSTTDRRDNSNIIDFMNYPKRIFPIGRLDKPSSGLILLTNDGDIVNKILRVEHEHDKEYVVTVDKPISKTFLHKMAAGVPIMGTMTKRCAMEKLTNFKFKIILIQGLNRQIRRMCEHFGYKVKTLKRIRIMNIKLGNLGLGSWRYLTEQELKGLNSGLKHNKS